MKNMGAEVNGVKRTKTEVTRSVGAEVATAELLSKQSLASFRCYEHSRDRAMEVLSHNNTQGGSWAAQS